MNIQRIRVFLHLVGKRDAAGNRLSPRNAWRLAGIAIGQLAAMPDAVIEWWWKVQDLLPPKSANQPAGPQSARPAENSDTLTSPTAGE
jgi:hypothetical protein